ncbi:pH-response regulator protein palH/prr-4 [Ceratocystis fimbriata CBS 114723]|uniref:pH-response regulator protein palH/prr-4 n=1 Tax=Ceratocystis fimbriata CBS 114723 TaxID=1035309 RepID=A0A2C5WZE4_9PEZI|nr:pH-response regulator protein palH/prr-4 [Ceratocystis fimbriata CBS 114723]
MASLHPIAGLGRGLNHPTAVAATVDCSQPILFQNNILSYANGGIIRNLGRAASYVLECSSPHIHIPSRVNPLQPRSTVDPSTVTIPSSTDLNDPFYASKFPVMYALAATTVTAYMLVIMLFITPRSFLDGGIVYLGRRGGFTSGSTGGINIGGRPWLQKVAAISVAISLTIASSSTFDVAQRQYEVGVLNTKQLQFEVMDGTELKVIRLISDTFLWLAQAQTLIRLFPRHREKVIIKWTAFALIILDVIFSALDSFKYNSTASSRTHPRTFVDAIPALSYLFQLSLGLLYAAWVIYYAIMKKRYSFYHPLMKNMILMAMMSLVSILIPVVFFIMDIVNPEFTGWGDYVRWVGAAAASVVVWEWVERIEALEREEKKDGILGREVFDGDEMLDSSSSVYRRKRSSGTDDDGSEKRLPNTRTQQTWSSALRNQRRLRRLSRRHDEPPTTTVPAPHRDIPLGDSPWLQRPPVAVTPISRTDTTSVSSTVYTVRRPHQSETPMERVAEDGPPSRGTSPTRSQWTADDQPPPPALPTINTSPGAGAKESTATITTTHNSSNSQSLRLRETSPTVPTEPQSTTATDLEANNSDSSTEGRRRRWLAMPSFNDLATPILSRSSAQDSSNVQVFNNRTEETRPSHGAHDDIGRWDIRGRFEEFAVSQAEKIRERFRPQNNFEELPTFDIPAPQRMGEPLQQLLEEEEQQQQQQSDRRRSRRPVYSLFRASSGLGIQQQPNGSDVLGRSISVTDHANPNSQTVHSLGSATSPGAYERLNSSSSVMSGVRQEAPPMWPGVHPRVEADDSASGPSSSAGVTRR